MYNYIREQSTKEIIRSTFEIYGKHFFTIFFTYFILVFPIYALLQGVQMSKGIGILWTALFFIYLFVSLFANVVLIVSISDICLGNKPSIWRSYKRMLTPFLGNILITNFLELIIGISGFVLLIIPGIIFLTWFMFSGPVVIIEKIWGINALKRSKDLGKGHYLRCGGLFISILTIGGLIPEVLKIIGVRIASILNFSEYWTEIVFIPLNVLFQPIGVIFVILMYYDLRARKEAYDSTMLAEDLKH